MKDIYIFLRLSLWWPCDEESVCSPAKTLQIEESSKLANQEIKNRNSSSTSSRVS